ncbi:uncharacterized protein LOC131175919 [Hevea brasiliensis]|uniref:uncharacterized protein LOC131175919 n=1 Tax=Hevea brasiliensis TaxID=3981 RepID=UPI0025F85FD6|nr:uncharacterized protein LOC131175919 [Hevea brasiliensis]
MKRSELLLTPGHEAEEMQGGSSQPSVQSIPDVEAIRSPPHQEEPPPPPPAAPRTERGPSQFGVRNLSRGAQVLIHSLEKNRTVRENPDLAKHIVREKAHRLSKEVEQKSHEVSSLRSQISSAQNYISDIEGQMKLYQDKLAEQTRVLAERTRILEEVQALRTDEVARLALFTEELKTPGHEAEEMQGGSSQPSVQPIPDVEAIRSPPHQEEPPPPPPAAPRTKRGPSQFGVRNLSRGTQVLIHSLEKNRTVRENPNLAKHIVREKAHCLSKEVEQKSHEVSSLRSQISSTQNYIFDIEGQMKLYEDKLAEQTRVLAERTRILEEVQALRTNEVARLALLTEELKAKEEEMVTGVAGAYGKQWPQPI